ncbi:hypothetical protein ACFQ0B_23515 [Nonomuraea thailandensis]
MAVLTLLNLFGVQRSAGVARIIVAFVLAVLAVVILAGLTGDDSATFGWFARTPETEVFLRNAAGPYQADGWG